MAEYISLQEASRLCSYSQEYLSLRARQGKLKALKLGRNWVCTKEWLQEYIVKSEEFRRSPTLNKKKSDFKVVEPPRNLPIYAPDAEMWEDEIPEDVERQKEFQRKFQFALALAMVAALSLASIFQGREQFFPIAGKASEEVILFVVSLQDMAQETGFSAGERIQVFLGAASPPNEDRSVREVMKSYFAWLLQQARNIINGN